MGHVCVMVCRGQRTTGGGGGGSSHSPKGKTQVVTHDKFLYQSHPRLNMCPSVYDRLKVLVPPNTMSLWAND